MYKNLAILGVLLALAVNASADLTCYYIDRYNDTIMTYTVTDPSYVCTSYDITCYKGEPACTTDEQAAGTNKTIYSFTSNATCDALMASPQSYRNVVCCNTNLCNAPPATPAVAAPNAAPTAATPTGSSAPQASTPVKANFGSVIIPSTVLFASAIALIY